MHPFFFFAFQFGLTTFQVLDNHVSSDYHIASVCMCVCLVLPDSLQPHGLIAC